MLLATLQNAEKSTRHEVKRNDRVVGSVVEHDSGRVDAFVYGDGEIEHVGSWYTFPVEYARGRVLYEHRTRNK